MLAGRSVLVLSRRVQLERQLFRPEASHLLRSYATGSKKSPNAPFQGRVVSPQRMRRIAAAIEKFPEVYVATDPSILANLITTKVDDEKIKDVLKALEILRNTELDGKTVSEALIEKKIDNLMDPDLLTWLEKTLLDKNGFAPFPFAFEKLPEAEIDKIAAEIGIFMFCFRANKSAEFKNFLLEHVPPPEVATYVHQFRHVAFKRLAPAMTSADKMKSTLHHSKLLLVHKHLRDLVDGNITQVELITKLNALLSLHMDALQPMYEYLFGEKKRELHMFTYAKKGQRVMLQKDLEDEIWKVLARRDLSHVDFNVSEKKKYDLPQEIASLVEAARATAKARKEDVDTVEPTETPENLGKKFANSRLFLGIHHIFQVNFFCKLKSGDTDDNINQTLLALGENRTILPGIRQSTITEKLSSSEFEERLALRSKEYDIILQNLQDDETNEPLVHKGIETANGPRFGDNISTTSTHTESEGVMAAGDKGSIAGPDYPYKSSARKFFLVNLPSTVTEDDIRKAMKYCGEVEKVFIYTHKFTAVSEEQQPRPQQKGKKKGKNSALPTDEVIGGKDAGSSSNEFQLNPSFLDSFHADPSLVKDTEVLGDDEAFADDISIEDLSDHDMVPKTANMSQKSTSRSTKMASSDFDPLNMFPHDEGRSSRTAQAATKTTANTMNADPNDESNAGVAVPHVPKKKGVQRRRVIERMESLRQPQQNLTDTYAYVVMKTDEGFARATSNVMRLLGVHIRVSFFFACTTCCYDLKRIFLPCSLKTLLGLS